MKEDRGVVLHVERAAEDDDWQQEEAEDVGVELDCVDVLDLQLLIQQLQLLSLAWLINDRLRASRYHLRL